LLDITNINNYIFTVNIKKGNYTKNTNASIIFNYTDEKNYKKIDIVNKNLVISQVKNGKELPLRSFNSTNVLLDTIYNKFSVIFRFPKITLKYNEKTLMWLTDTTFLKESKVGFGSKNGDLYFDNIENSTDLKPLFQETFFYIDVYRMKEGTKTLKWKFHEGDWNWNRNKGIMSIEAIAGKKGFALVTVGKEYWKDYWFTTATRIKEEAGICFYVQDDKNYYLFKAVFDEHANGKLQLAKIENNKESILCEKNYRINKGEWYKLAVKTSSGEISAFLDDKNLINYTDNTFQDGAIGLWCNSTKDTTLFDDIHVKPSSSILNNTVHFESNYEFEMREKAGLDFCDWENSVNIFTQRNINGINQYVGIEKKLFEEARMMNKRILSGYIKILVDHKDILPKDIAGNIIFEIWENGKIISYKFIIAHDKIAVAKDNKILKERNIRINRKAYVIEYKNHTWLIKSEEKIIFEYSENSYPQKIKVGISYSGIGSGHIAFNNVNLYADRYINE